MTYDMAEGDADRCPADLPVVPMQVSLRDVIVTAFRACMHGNHQRLLRSEDDFDARQCRHNLKLSTPDSWGIDPFLTEQELEQVLSPCNGWSDRIALD